MIQELFIKQYITNYKKRGKTYLLTNFLENNNSSKENVILQMLILCDKEYFNSTNTEPSLTDTEYDILREFANEVVEIKKDYTKLYNYLNFNVGAEITNILTKKKINLPYEIRSLNKIKNDQKALSDWSNKYSSPAEYIITPKLDGISGLYTTNSKGENNLYTRGSGTVGLDISDFIPILELNQKLLYLIEYIKENYKDTETIALRGEFVITREKFNTKYKDKGFQNSRNFVSGLFNRKTIDRTEIEDIDFVIHEIIEPKMIPYQQYHILNIFLKTAIEFNSITEKDLTVDSLTTLLTHYKCQFIKDLNDTNITFTSPASTTPKLYLSNTEYINYTSYPYDIDGIVIKHNFIHEMISGENPKYAFAFKLLEYDEKAQTTVEKIEWTPSKDGFIKPRIKLKPVLLEGSTINYTTGKNAKYIVENKITVGTRLEITKSGGVIPEITKIYHEDLLVSDIDYLPSFETVGGEYKWNETMIDIVLVNPENNIESIIKNLIYFSNTISCKNLSKQTIRKLVISGFDTPKKLVVDLKISDILQLDGFKEKSAKTLYENIQESVKNASTSDIIVGSNLLGRGISSKKLKKILDIHPDLFTPNTESLPPSIDELCEIPNISIKTAELILKSIPNIKIFIQELNDNN